MLTRSAALIALPLLLAGCAGEAPPLSSFSTSGLAIATPPAVAAPSPEQPHRKTMADRVLAAIALERVTGLKPDPARFVE